MATITQGNYLTALAGANLSTSPYYIVKLNSTGQAVLTAAATDDIAGVLDDIQQSSPVPQSTSGGLVSIAVVNGTGTFKVIAGASIAKDAYLTSNGSGQAVTAVQTVGGTAPSVRVFGRARTAANSGDVVEYIKMFMLY